ncbi:MAG: 2-oxoacid:acceptor oxidoreductase subunit alpha [Armatimonadetes bacterium]|nr:2-oxoacid:acceptor oxidoreductase subunit alpha [Armatimonadota bacterium]
MAHFDLTIRLAGENGEGLLTVGDQLAVTMSRMGLQVYTFQNLPAEIKGGASMAQLRVSDTPVLSPGDKIDILEVWNQENYEIHISDVSEDTILLYDPNETTPDERAPRRSYPIPLDKIAREEIQAIRSKNVVAWSIFLALLGVEKETAVLQFHKSRWSKRKESLEANLKAIDAGYAYGEKLVEESGISMRLPVDPHAEHDPQMILTGNTAIGMGSLAAGLQFYAGYPITPASDIMEFFAKQLPRFGGVIVQTEDEIAALAAVIGASFAGRKSMTATSGPGLSLMVEEMGLASMEEIPLVIVDAMRGGPSTGMPTKPEQGDLELAVYGRHGEAPRIVMAPTDVADCFYTTIQAFNLAEKYQSPVLLLSDQHLSHRSETVPPFDLERVPKVERLLPPLPEASENGHGADGNGASPNGASGNGEKASAKEEAHAYERYAFTESGISPMAIPGVHNHPYVATGLEHNEHAHIDYSPRMHVLMTHKRYQKINGVLDEPAELLVKEFGPQDAELGVIVWGSTQGPLLEAMQRLEAKGHKVQALIPRMLSPLPAKQIQAFLDRVQQVVVVELNYTGQLARMLQAEFCRPVLRFNKYMGMPFTAGEIEEYLESILVSS